MYKGYDQLKVQVLALYQRLKEMGYDQLPCHNDLVAANLVKDKNGRLYLIDWEYSGINDPMLIWRLCFWRMIFPLRMKNCFSITILEKGGLVGRPGKDPDLQNSQDFLWSIWTVLKEAKGDDFGSYGPDRFHRAQALCDDIGKPMANKEEPMKSTEKSMGRIDWSLTIFPLVAIVLLAALLLLFPENSGKVIESLRSFLVNDIGFIYIVLDWVC